MDLLKLTWATVVYDIDRDPVYRFALERSLFGFIRVSVLSYTSNGMFIHVKAVNGPAKLSVIWL